MIGRRLVIDTNVLLSALLFRGTAMAWMRTAWQTGTILPLASQETVSELLRVLGYPKFRLTVSDREHLLSDYLPWCEAVTIPVPPPLVPDCRDPFDRPFLVLSVAGNADALVTGDRDLLALAPDFPIPIITPAELRFQLTE